MPTSKKSDRTPKVGDRVRVFVDTSMIDEPAEIIRVERDNEITVHLWPGSPERTALSCVQWFAEEMGAANHGLKGAWPE